MTRALSTSLIVLAFSLAFAATASAQQFTYYFPQVASGEFSDGTWQTTIFITNATSGAAAAGSITFTRSDGGPFEMGWLDEWGQPVTMGNVISFQLAGGETRKYVSFSSAPLSQGFAKVTASAPVLGTAMFTQFDHAGNMIGEAGVPAAIPLGRQAIFVDTIADFKTGFAIANPNNVELHINMELINAQGQKIGTVRRDLAPNQHFAAFIHDLFPDAPPIVGRLQFWCQNPMVSVGVRMEPNLELFTTLPPIAIE
jgi:hypothetical protein